MEKLQAELFRMMIRGLSGEVGQEGELAPFRREWKISGADATLEVASSQVKSI
eukprot:SAG31_NODE_1701_length_7496_cov_248.949169_2_plen_53_part_00